jgi:hypothetical protein
VKAETSKVSKSREEIRTIHQRRMRGRNQSHRGKAQQEVVYWPFGHWDIENAGDKRFGHFGITRYETLIRREVPLWEPVVNVVENWDLKDR